MGNLNTVVATVSGIQNLVVNSAEAVTVNTKTGNAGWSGVTQVTANTASGGQSSANADSITAAAATNVTVNDAAASVTGGTAAGGVTVIGGNNVTVNEKGKTTTASDINIGGTTAPTGAVTVNVTGTSGNTTVTVLGGASAAVSTTQTGAINVSGVTGATSVTSTSTTSGQVNVSGGTSDTINTYGGSSIYAGQNSGSNVVPVAGAVTITDTNSNFGSAQKDSIAVFATGQVTVKTGALSTATGSGSITIGDTTASHDSSVGVSVTQMTGTKYGTQAANIFVNAAPSVTVAGGVAAIADQATTHGLATVSLTGTSGAETISSNALTTLNLTSITGAASGTGQSVTITGSSTAPVSGLTLNLSGVGSAPTSGDKYLSVVDNYAKTITVNALTDSYLALSDSLASSTYGKFSSLAINATGAFKLEALTLASGQTVAITTSGAGNVTLGDLSGNVSSSNDTNVSSITASGTGAVSAEIDAYYTTFAGGASGNDTVTLDYSATPTSASIVGSTGGANTLILTDTAAHLGFGTSALTTTNFQTLELGKAANLAAAAAGTYSGAGFTTVGVVGALAGPATFSNLASGTALLQTVSPTAAVTYSLATAPAAATGNAATFTYGKATSTGVTSTTNVSDVQSLTVNSITKANVYTNQYANTVTINDGTTIAAANSLASMKVTGAGGIALTLTSTNAVAALTAIDASAATGAVTVTSVDANSVAAAGMTVTGGSGKLTVSNSANIANVVSGSGGAAVTVGASGGAVNLTASAAKADTIKSAGGTSANTTTVTGFNAALTNADIVDLNGVGASVLANGNGSTASGGTYTVKSGIVTFGGSESASINVQLADVKALVNAGGTTAAFYNAGTGNTYVVSSDASAHYTVDVLSGVSGVTSVGTTAAANTIKLATSATGTAIGFTANTAVTSIASSSNASQDDTGYNAAAFTVSNGVSSAATTYTNTFANLSQSGTLTITNNADSTSSPATHVGQVATTQVGTSGTNSLSVNLYSADSSATTDTAVVVDKLTIAGDLTVNVNVGQGHPTSITDVISTLVDSTNTMTTLTLGTNSTNTPALTIGAITSTSLTTIDASSDAGAITLGGSGTEIAQAGLTIKGALGGSTIYVKGASDVISTTSAKAASIYSLGDSNSITLATNTRGAADAADLTGAQAVYLSGKGSTVDASNVGTGTGNFAVTIQGATAGSAVGDNATVKLGVGIASYVDTVYAGVNTSVSIGGGYNVVDVHNTSAAYGTTANMTTVSLGSHLGSAVSAYASSDKVVIATASASETFTVAGVNVAGSATLAAALTIAAKAAETGTTIDATHSVTNWFQYGGDTYIYEGIGTGASGTHLTTGVDTTDVVVKLTGLVDLGAANTTSSLTGHAILLG